MRRLPPELALGFGVRRAAKLGHHHDADLASKQPSDESRHAHRLLCVQGLGKRGQPLGNGGRVVVDHVVDTSAATLDRRDGRLGRVGDVDEGPHAGGVADQRELALADRLELLRYGAFYGPGTSNAP